jgi:hypothetical protein
MATYLKRGILKSTASMVDDHINVDIYSIFNINNYRAVNVDVDVYSIQPALSSKLTITAL